MKSRLLLFLTLLSGSLEAQVVRTWVSGSGSDSNPCTRALPCRNFVAALAAVDADGEVVVLDSAGYGPVVVNKDVAIIAPEGVHAAIAPTFGAAIQITGSTFATLRNLYLNSQGGSRGIFGGSGGVLQIEDCTVSGFGEGILVDSDGGEVYISDTVIRNGSQGIALYAYTSPLTAVLNRVAIRRNGDKGVLAVDNVRAVITDSSLAGNHVQIWVFGIFGDPEFDIQNTVLMGRGAASGATGIFVDTSIGRTSTVRVSGCLITANGAAFSVGDSGGISLILSRGDNTLEGNAGSNAFPGTFNPK